MFNALYLQTAYISRPGTELNLYSQTDFTDPVPFACRYQPSNRLIRNNLGEQVVGEATLYTNEPVTTRDLVYPPGADTSDATQARHPLAVHVYFDLLTGAESYRAVHI